MMTRTPCNVFLAVGTFFFIGGMARAQEALPSGLKLAKIEASPPRVAA